MSATDVIWHDVECGAYAADLPMWEDLAASASATGGGAEILDLGAGTGRVAMHLAARGHRVWALDKDPDLIGALTERAERLEGLTPLLGDACSFDLGRRFALVLAPMQLAHLLTPAERAAMLASIAAHLEPGGWAAVAIMSEMPGSWQAGPDKDLPPPDVRERDDWVYSSLPVAIEAGGDGILVRRLRQTVSPEGALAEEEHVFSLLDLPAAKLEEEAAGAGLVPRERREVPETDDFVGSTVVILEAGR